MGGHSEPSKTIWPVQIERISSMMSSFITPLQGLRNYGLW